ncbi:MAG: glycosyltransferase [Oliverpabstia sp.]|nr:glycosyltransferase [Oliverpabstia sp.]
MRLGFVFDTTFIKYKDHYYSINLTNEFWKERYLPFFEEIVVVGRYKEVFDDPSDKYVLSDSERVVFKCIKDTSLLRRLGGILLSDSKFIEENIRSCDRVICRGSWGTKICKRLRIPYMVNIVADPWDSYWNHSNLGKIVAPFFCLALKKAAYQAPFVSYVSRRYLQNRYPSKGEMGACPDVFLETPCMSVLEKRIERIKAQASDKVTIGLIGSTNVGYRGHLTVIKAVAELKKRGIICQAKFLGGDANEHWNNVIQEFDVEDRVLFCGRVQGQEAVFKWIDDIDILVMPAKAETLGRAIIEAMSRGCPVIGSLETAIGEQIGSDCLCSASDYSTVADLIEKMISNKAYMKYCAQENFYRSYKYCNEQNDEARNSFLKRLINFE